MIDFLRNLPWKNTLLLVGLLLFEVSIHPLGFGPDRRIHDPAVYRLSDPNYLSEDWYTNMAAESGVYLFYARLIHVNNYIGISEEAWRQLLYILCLVITYYSLIRIARIFSENPFVAPLLAGFHAFFILYNPPTWLYGVFIHIDGGLAPRSIGIALSFLSLLYLLEKRPYAPWIILGIATLIHVSNAFLVFVLFFLVQLLIRIYEENYQKQSFILTIFVEMKKSFLSGALYLFSGGWFAVISAIQNSGAHTTFPIEKFIWAWIYFRAPYMDLPDTPLDSWKIFGAHVIVMFLCWYFLRVHYNKEKRNSIDMLAFVGTGSLIFFFFFYFFTFVYPWLPGFQFYSIRIIYFLYFCAYLFLALVVIDLPKYLENWLKERKVSMLWFQIAYFGLFFTGYVAVSMQYSVAQKYLGQVVNNINQSFDRLKNASMKKSSSSVEQSLIQSQEIFLAPPDWFGPAQYIPHIASFKVFGFTPTGLEEWYDRLNTVSRGELDRAYEKQTRSGRFKPVFINWRKVYGTLTEQEVYALAEKYHFHYFVTYEEANYPFEMVTDDSNFRLYRVTAPVPR